jgi:hypothetical protein
MEMQLAERYLAVGIRKKRGSRGEGEFNPIICEGPRPIMSQAMLPLKD